MVRADGVLPPSLPTSRLDSGDHLLPVCQPACLFASLPICRPPFCDSASDVGRQRNRQIKKKRSGGETEATDVARFPPPIGGETETIDIVRFPRLYGETEKAFHLGQPFEISFK